MEIGCSRLFKVVQGCSRLFKVVQGCSRLFKVVQGCSRLFKVVQGCSRLFKVVQGCSRLFKVVQGCSRLFKVVQGCSRLFGRCLELWGRESIPGRGRSERQGRAKGQGAFFLGEFLVAPTDEAFQELNRPAIVGLGFVQADHDLSFQGFANEILKINGLNVGLRCEGFPFEGFIVTMHAEPEGQVLEVEFAEAVVMDFEAEAFGRGFGDEFKGFTIAGVLQPFEKAVLILFRKVAENVVGSDSGRYLIYPYCEEFTGGGRTSAVQGSKYF